MRTRLFAAAIVSLFLVPESFASGYDTPVLYTARHIGMGGTAIGYVNDPSALFHNPAGMAQGSGGAVMLNASPLSGTIHASPSAEGKNVSQSGLIPMFLGGASYNIKGLSFGLAFYPLGGGSGSYTYSFKEKGQNPKTITRTDMTGLAFIEVAPGIAYEFDLLGGKVRVGAAYRYTLTTFQRKITDHKEGEDEPSKYHDIDLEGANTLGYRVGLQGTFGDLDIGIVYRSGFNVKMTEVDRGDTMTVVQQTPAENVGFEFTLPRKLGMGARLRMTDSIRLAADLEYLFNSDNKTSSFTGKECAFGECKQELSLTNYAMWDDGMTIHLGGEYQVNESIFARLGYIYDTKSANSKYPSAFGTPPAPTMSYTIGGEYRVGQSLSIAVAFAYRTGSADITEDQLGKDDKGNIECQFCGKEGTYSIDMLGGYLDAVIRF